MEGVEGMEGEEGLKVVEKVGFGEQESVMEKRAQERWRRQQEKFGLVEKDSVNIRKTLEERSSREKEDDRCSSSLGFVRPLSSVTEQTSLSLRSTKVHAQASVVLTTSSKDSNSVEMSSYEPNMRGRSNTEFSSQLSDVTGSIALTSPSCQDNISLTSLAYKGRESVVPWTRPDHPVLEEEEEEEEEMEPDSLDFTDEAGDAIEKRQASMERRTRERLKRREAESLERRALKERQRQREEVEVQTAAAGSSGFNVYCVQYDLQDCWTINKLSG